MLPEHGHKLGDIDNVPTYLSPSRMLGMGAICVLSPTLDVGRFCGHLLTAAQIESQSWGKLDGFFCLLMLKA